jgi:hypothetical protein
MSPCTTLRSSSSCPEKDAAVCVKDGLAFFTGSTCNKHTVYYVCLRLREQTSMQLIQLMQLILVPCSTAKAARTKSPKKTTPSVIGQRSSHVRIRLHNPIQFLFWLFTFPAGLRSLFQKIASQLKLSARMVRLLELAIFAYDVSQIYSSMKYLACPRHLLLFTIRALLFSVRVTCMPTSARPLVHVPASVRPPAYYAITRPIISRRHEWRNDQQQDGVQEGNTQQLY